MTRRAPDPVDRDLESLSALDTLIEHAEVLRQLKGTPGWALLESALRQVRDQAFESILSSSSQNESDDTRKGFAKCINYIFNLLSGIITDGDIALSQKQELMTRVRNQAKFAPDSEGVALTRRGGGMVE